MELRKKIKRPQRYQPDHDKHPWESHISNALPPASATPFVDFNPDLPAAAFPTLEQPSIATRCPALSSETARSTVATEGGRSRIVQREEAGELLQPTDTSRESWLASNGPQNQIFMNNLQLLRRDMGKSEEDWVMQEMETSDEEEQLAMVSSKTVFRADHLPRWDNLSEIVQLRVVDLLSMHMTREEACERLELTKTQQSRIFQHQVHRERQEALEDSRIMSMHAEQMALLLDGNSKSLGRVTPEIFRTSIEKYLYNDLGDTYHRTVSERELIDGQIFLKALGLDPDLSTEWFDLPDDEDSCKFHFGRQLAQISSNSSDISKLST